MPTATSARAKNKIRKPAHQTIGNTRGFDGGLNGRRSQTDVMSKMLVAAMDVVKDGGHT